MKTDRILIYLFFILIATGLYLAINPLIENSYEEEDVEDMNNTENETPEISVEEGNRLFIDPLQRFSFQYKERIDGEFFDVGGNPPNYFGICGALTCLGVGIGISPLQFVDGRVEYDYTRHTHDRNTPDSYEEINFRDNTAYRAIFGWKEHKERYLFIHIPYKDQLITLYRSTIDYKPSLEQFEILQSTFTLY